MVIKLVIGLVLTGSFLRTFPNSFIEIVRAADSEACTQDSQNLTRQVTTINGTLNTLTGYESTMFSGGTSDNYNAQDGYLTQLGSERGSYANPFAALFNNLEKTLTDFSVHNCSQSTWDSAYQLYQDAVASYNRHVTFAGEHINDFDGNQRYRVSALQPYHLKSFNYQEAKSDCVQQIIAANQIIQKARTNMSTAVPIIQKWALNGTDQTIAADEMTKVAEFNKQATAAILELQKQGCDKDPKTSGDYKRLKTDYDALNKEYHDLNDSLGAKANTLLSQGATTVGNILEGIGNCEPKKGDPTWDTFFMRPIYRGVCVMIGSISLGLGTIACYIVGYIVDPIFSGKYYATCSGSTSGNTAPSGAAASTPPIPGSGGSGGNTTGGSGGTNTGGTGNTGGAGSGTGGAGGTNGGTGNEDPGPQATDVTDPASTGTPEDTTNDLPAGGFDNLGQPTA